MAAFDFPNSPSNGQVYNAPNGKQYTYNSANSCWRGGTVLGAQGVTGSTGAQGHQGRQGAAAAGTNGVVRQVLFTKGPASQTSYNSSSWTTVISQAITMQNASNNTLVTVTYGLYGGDEGNTYRGGKLLRNTSTIWEATSIWGRAGTLKAEQSGLQIIDNPGSGTSTYHFQLREHDSSGSNNVIIFPNNCQISVMEYTP